MTREVPGLWGRFGPYSRMVVKTLLSIVFLQLLLAGALYAIAHPHETVDAFMRGKGGGKSVGNLVGHAFITLLMGGIGCFYAVSWLRRLGSVWTRVGELLDDGEVLPMRMRVLTRGSGKTRTTFIALDPLEAGGWRLRETEVGMFMPWWVRRKENERVYVHGAEGPGPYVVEFSNGLLTLLDPD